jgi:hypothetical protein
MTWGLGSKFVVVTDGAQVLRQLQDAENANGDGEGVFVDELKDANIPFFKEMLQRENAPVLAMKRNLVARVLHAEHVPRLRPVPVDKPKLRLHCRKPRFQHKLLRQPLHQKTSPPHNQVTTHPKTKHPCIQAA